MENTIETENRDLQGLSDDQLDAKMRAADRGGPEYQRILKVALEKRQKEITALKKAGRGLFGKADPLYVPVEVPEEKEKHV